MQPSRNRFTLDTCRRCAWFKRRAVDHGTCMEPARMLTEPQDAHAIGRVQHEHDSCVKWSPRVTMVHAAQRQDR